MMATELMAKLAAAVAEHGDHPVHAQCEGWVIVSDLYFDPDGYDENYNKQAQFWLE